ncbi:hypothetical protein BH24ACT4_BH24ACT4_24570 [soil metagenome]
MSRRIALVSAALVALVLTVSACGGDTDTIVDQGAAGTGPPTTTGPSDPAPGPDDLEARSFVATSITEDGNPRSLVDGTRLRLVCEDGTLRVDAGCNQMGGRFATDGPTLTVGPLDTTAMGCQPERMDQDAWIADVLARDLTVTLDGDTLTLVAGSTTLILEDEAVSSTPTDLTGTEWTVDTLIQGDVASTPPAGVVATLRFSADGSYAVTTGCNTGSGTFEVDEQRLDLTPPALTKRACKADAATVEQAVVAVLDGKVSFSVEGGRLTLTLDPGAEDGATPLGRSGLGLIAG